MSDFDPTAPVTSVITGQMNAKQAREEQKRQHRYNKELMGLSYKYGQAEQQNSALNTKLGYMLAGMSPALAANGMFAPAGGASPLPSSAAPSRYPKFESGASLSGLLQLDNIKAQTENIKAQTESTQIKNEQEKDENVSARGLVNVFLQDMVDQVPEENYLKRARLQAIADVAKNKGSLQALSMFTDSLNKRSLYDYQELQNSLKRAVTEYQLGEKHGKQGHSIIADLAELPSNEFAQSVATTRKLLSEVDYLKSQKGLSEEERNLRLSQIKLTDEQIANLKAVTKRLNDTNLMKIAEEGDPLKLAAALAFLILGNVHVGF